MPAQNMAEYMAKRRADRRKGLIAWLGGVCVRCGTREDLEFDHIDPATLSFRINGPSLDKPWRVLYTEARKCQLLCRQHHWEKTLENGEVAVVEHGGGSSGKKNCKCQPCKERKAEYMRVYGHPSRGVIPA
jgi:hypothetical protein